MLHVPNTAGPAPPRPTCRLEGLTQDTCLVDTLLSDPCSRRHSNSPRELHTTRKHATEIGAGHKGTVTARQGGAGQSRVGFGAAETKLRTNGGASRGSVQDSVLE
ncbi:hypothetical protein E2C01_011202 [Portunus trituberculatus]|uniref:Uncharacterized protein n=1 Tax=Portunus trituberculatus TaxID=210409 RepID=A0A5B7DAS5_PORTR|nr:hypothetical protein [Portunus trituberculatus]